MQKLQPYNRLELSVRQPALKSIMLQHDDLIAMRTHFNKTNTLQEKEKIGFLNKSSIRFSPEGFQSPNNSDVKTKTSRLFHVTGGRLGYPFKAISPLMKSSKRKREKSYGFAKTTT